MITPPIGPLCRARYECTHDSCKAIRDPEQEVPDALVMAAEFLIKHLDWLRHRSATEIQECFADIAAAARVVAGIARGPSEQKYLGPCGALIPQMTADYVADVLTTERMSVGSVIAVPCDGDVYGRAGAEKGACRTCGATVDQAERRAWLDEQVGGSDLAWTARGIADALSINVKTVRAWATPRISDTGHVLREAKLATYYRLGEHVVPWTEPEEGEDIKARGPRLHYVGDVRRLAKEAAEHREAERLRIEAKEAVVAS